MIVKILIASIAIGVVVGLASGNVILGGVLANGIFFTGLLVVIANSLLNMSQAATPGANQPPADEDPDSDLIEDFEMVFDEDTGELVEVPAASTKRRRRR